MNKLFRLAAAAALALLVASPGWAQGSALIHGQVKDFEGRPSSGAKLILKNDQTGETYTLTTDRDGRFSQPGATRGVYTLELRGRAQGSQEETTIYQTKVDISDPSVRDKEVNLNLQALYAEQQEALQKQEAALKKFDDMKMNFDAGVAALQQARQLQAQIRATPRAERAPLQQQFEQQQQVAVTSLQAAVEGIADPNDSNLPLVLAKLGEAYETAGRYEDAAGSYQRAVELKPDAGYYNNLGNVLAKAGKIEQATQAYQKSAELNPAGAAQAWTNLGIVLQSTGKPKEAAEALRKALDANPKYALAWYVLGSALLGTIETRQEGDKLIYIVPPGTVEAYEKYLELAPDGPYANDARASLQALESMGAGVNIRYRRTKKGT